MRKIIHAHKDAWRDRTFAKAAIIAIVFFLICVQINYAANSFATRRASGAVNDIILDNIPVLAVDNIIIGGTIALIIFGFGILIYRPRCIPFALKSVAVFILIRSAFVSMTHLGPLPERVLLGSGKIFGIIGVGRSDDLFFSGHTGLPYLLALLLWDVPWLRNIFLAFSIFLATSMLLGHLHYSIDVFGAYFITYTIYHIVLVLFPKDRKLFETGIQA